MYGYNLICVGQLEAISAVISIVSLEIEFIMLRVLTGFARLSAYV